MANYDFKAAKKYIQMHSDLIESATIGMEEDWFWTAQTVFEGGIFTENLDDEKLKIGGISGSDWATPMLEVTMKDGSEVKKVCAIGDIGEKEPEWFSLGCLSQECQDIRSGKMLNT